MKIRHFYHVWAPGAWEIPAAGHVAALGAAGFTHPVIAGLTGPPADRDRARGLLSEMFLAEGLLVPAAWIEADEGWEQVTLAVLHEYAGRCDDGDAIFYAHTKGAWNDTPLTRHWRDSMTRHVAGQWPRCAALVTRGGYDTAGCHWLIPGQQHADSSYRVSTPVYAGNFWWARASYLSQLPAPAVQNRHQAEEWIGLGAPRAYDLLPGWPSVTLCISPAELRDLLARVTRLRGPAGGFGCAHADETCGGPASWASVSREYRDPGDFMPLCQSHKDRHLAGTPG